MEGLILESLRPGAELASARDRLLKRRLPRIVIALDAGDRLETGDAQSRRDRGFHRPLARPQQFVGYETLTSPATIVLR